MSIEISAKFKEGRALYVLIPLLILHLTLLSVQIEDPSGTHLFRKWALQISSPILNVSSSLWGGMRRTWNGYIWLRGAREENERLRERVRQLSLREDTVAQIEAENARLRQLMTYKEARSFTTLGSRIVGRAPNYLASVVYIDRGSNDGIRVDHAVLADNGVFGRVVLVTPHTSHVQLITNADAAVGAMVERTRSPGVLTGTGNPVLDLNYINNTEQVEVNDLIVTSGLDGVFPKGLPLGRVVESRKGNSVFRVVRVTPLADLIHVEEVLILIGPGQPSQD